MDKHGIYVISKAKHAAMWQHYRAKGIPIISSWINDGEESTIDFSEAWPRYLAEASKAASIIVYLEPGDVLKGGLAEMGAGLASGARVIILGNEVDQFRTLQYHPAVYLNHIRTIDDIFEVLDLVRDL
jgi:hypothetical protein